jgi:hypothetical protein
LKPAAPRQAAGQAGFREFSLGQIKAPPLAVRQDSSMMPAMLAPGPPIFLHTGWRSRGTWLWDRLRADARVKAFYEPLHENLAVLDRDSISHFRPDSWGSGHGESAPYFAEYASLLGPRGQGVRLYRRRFAFEKFFLPPDQDDPELEAYLAQLLALAHAEGRQPVLKLCRSLGRAAWMRARFPDALHTVLLRDPTSQWRSSRRQLDRDGNRYFLLAPYLIMARNGGHPLLAGAMRGLGVTPPVPIGHGGAVTTTATWRHVTRLDWAQRYRGFLAVWAATAVAALSSGAEVIDADGLGQDGAQREDVAARFAAAGVLVDLHQARPPEPPAAWPGAAAEAGDAAAAARQALDFVEAHRAVLPAPHMAHLARLLAPSPLATSPLATSPLAPSPLTPSLDSPATAPAPAWRAPPKPAPMLLRQADALAYVAFERALFPLRRAHYYLWRWLGLHAGPGVRRG